MKLYLFVLILFSFSVSAQSQVEIDANPVDSTTDFHYYEDQSDKLLLKLMTVVKSNILEIDNINNEQSLNLKENDKA